MGIYIYAYKFSHTKHMLLESYYRIFFLLKKLNLKGEKADQTQRSYTLISGLYYLNVNLFLYKTKIFMHTYCKLF